MRIPAFRQSVIATLDNVGSFQKSLPSPLSQILVGVEMKLITPVKDTNRARWRADRQRDRKSPDAKKRAVGGGAPNLNFCLPEAATAAKNS